MGFTEFETENAKYRLELMFHYAFGIGQVKPKEYQRSDADAFVFEWVSSPILSFEVAKKKYDRGRVFDFAAKNQIGVWFPDVDIKPLRDIRRYIKHTALAIPFAYMLVSGLSDIREMIKARKKITRRELNKKIGKVVGKFGVGVVLHPWFWLSVLSAKGKIKKREPIRKFFAKSEHWWPNIAAEGRNAVNAEKMEKFIAPTLRKRLGRKPTIYLCFGAGHSGLQELLQHPKRREKILKAFSPPEAFFKPINLRRCVEYKFEPKTKKWNYQAFEKAIRFPEPQVKALPKAKAKPRTKPKREPKISRRQFLRKTIRA